MYGRLVLLVRRIVCCFSLWSSNEEQRKGKENKEKEKEKESGRVSKGIQVAAMDDAVNSVPVRC